MTTKSLLHSSLLDNLYYNSMLVGNDAYEPVTEEILAEEVLTSSQASFTFSSVDTLAAGYKHLQIRYMVRSTAAAANTGNVRMRYNGDTASNYGYHWLRGNGSSASSGATLSATSLSPGYFPYDGRPADIYASATIDILDPFETSKYTTFRSLMGTVSGAGENFVGLFSGLWLNTAAITSVTLFPESDSWKTGSRFTLIGVK